MANVTILDKIKSSGSYSSLDAKYGPYLSREAAHEALGENGDDVIEIGLTVGIKNGDRIIEYWYQDGTDLENLVQKDSFNKIESEARYQKKLESGINVKTVNNQSILGSGNINIEIPKTNYASAEEIRSLFEES